MGPVALALGTGGARGCAHIGVMRGLERMGLRPIGVAGSSMGALVGALYALGARPEELAALRLGARLRAIVRPRPSRHGLLDPMPLVELVRELIGAQTFADAGIRLAVTAVDLATDERLVIEEGPVAPAVVASMMVPAVFPSHQVGERWLHDPGLIDPIPVDVASRFGAETVVAVSADLCPPSPDRLVRCRPPLSWLFRGAGQLCGIVGTHGRWPWVSQLGCTFSLMSRDAAAMGYRPTWSGSSLPSGA